EVMKKKIKKEVQKIIEKDKFLIVIGGEHTISVGVVGAYREKIPDLKILILDAHADLREKYQGSKYSHACVTRRIVEMGFEVYVMGVRSISKEEVEFVEKEKKVKIFYAHQMKENWSEKMQKKIPEGKYYLSIDADFFDPSVIREVGNPEPGGFGWKDTILFLEKFISRKDIEITGFDFVELSPEKITSISSFISAKLIYKIIGLVEKYQKWKK
ncbi:agmatinase, partial [bacterium]|nr:agmatinase [bacterium]